MKHLLIIALFLIGSKCDAQHSIDSTAIVFSRIIYQDSVYTIHCIYKDTAVYDPASYSREKVVNSFTYSHYSHDTEFIYNHFEWLLKRIRDEREYWNVICKNNRLDRFAGLDAKFKHLDTKIGAAMKREYYSGMEDMLIDILYKHGQADWHFKSKDKSKRRTNP